MAGELKVCLQSNTEDF